MTQSSTMFIGVSTVAIPVSDQDRTKALLEDLGFETRLDADLGNGFRWIELAPPGASPPWRWWPEALIDRPGSTPASA